MNALRIGAALVLAALATGCTVVNPDQGTQAVLLDKPWFFGNGGVRDQAVLPGLQYTWFSTQAIYVNVYPQQFDANFDDLMTSDGVPLDFQTAVRLQVTDPVALIRRFGQRWYTDNVQQAFFNLVRDEVKKHGMNETAISTTAISEIDDAVTNKLAEYLKQENIPVHLLTVTVGKANPPDAIKTQRIATATEQQRIITETQRKLAEDGRRQAETSRAEADNAYREQMHLSPEQFVELERIKMQTAVCGAEGGKCTFLIGQAAQPVYHVN